MASGVRASLRWTVYTVAALLLLLLAAAFTAQFWLKGLIESTVSNRTGRQLSIDQLEVHWSSSPLLIAKGVQLANADWAQQDPMLDAGQLGVRIRLLPLLHGRLALPEVQLRNAHLLLQRGPKQQANWALGPPRPRNQKPSPLPQIERLSIRDSRVHYTDAEQNTDIKIDVRSDPEADQDKIITANGQGTVHGQSFALHFAGGSIAQLVAPDAPYDMRLHVAAADTEANLEGQVRDPRALKASDLDLRLQLSGPDPSRLYKLVSLPLPSLPPYSIKGKLVRNGKRWALSHFDGKVGDSDLHGDLALEFNGKRPLLTGDLHSKNLDFDDLGSLVGAPPGTGPGETASKQQRREKQHQTGGSVLPDKPIDLKQVQSIDANVKFTGERVRAGKLPIDEVRVDFQLDHGKMNFKPLAFGAGGGKVNTQLSIDATGNTLHAKLNGEFERLNLQRLLAGVDVAKDSVGQVGGRAKLWMRGNSAAALLASADGGVYLIMTGGRLDRMLVELAGLDIGEAVMAKLGEGKQSIPIDCGYADMEAKQGVLHLNKVVIDSSDTLFSASGTVNLANEQLDVQLTPHPKDISLFAARSELHIGGTLGDPQVRPGTATLAKGAAAAALAAVAGPAAALVPLIETGGGKDSVACGDFTRSVNARKVGIEHDKSGAEKPQ